MRVKTMSPTDEAVSINNQRGFFTIEIDGKKTLSFYDGESGDSNNTILKNFKDIYNITRAMQSSYEAGRRGEEFIVAHEDVDVSKNEDAGKKEHLIGKVQIRMHSSSSSIDLENVCCTYQKCDMFCVRFYTGRIQKYPISNIFDIVEDWHFGIDVK